MPITRSFTNDFEVESYTDELLMIPNEWGLITKRRIFVPEGVSTNTVAFEKQIQDGSLLVDMVRGTRNNVNQDYQRQLHAFAIPHFPLDDAIVPEDIQGKRAWGDFNRVDTLAEVRIRKMERIRRVHAWTQEYARALAITTGDVYAPNQTVMKNWYQEFGVTRKEVDFKLNVATTEPLAMQEEVIAHIQDNAGNGGMMTGLLGLASPEWFSQFIKHPNIKVAYTYFATNEQLLRNRASEGGSVTPMNRTFSFGGINYIEMRDTYPVNGVQRRLIPAGDVYFIPEGVDAFKTYYGPANTFSSINTRGLEAYMFEEKNPSDTMIKIQSETNFINVVTRPQAVVRGYTALV
jgi:Phage major capsid protein E